MNKNNKYCQKQKKKNKINKNGLKKKKKKKKKKVIWTKMPLREKRPRNTKQKANG